MAKKNKVVNSSYTINNESIPGVNNAVDAIAKKYNMNSASASAVLEKNTLGYSPRSGTTIKTPIPANQNRSLLNSNIDGSISQQGSYAIVNPYDEINKIYSPSGGVGNVLREKSRNKDYNDLMGVAKSVYDDGAKNSGYKNGSSLLGKYNSGMEKGTPVKNIPVFLKPNVSLADDMGVYFPDKKFINIQSSPKVSPYEKKSNSGSIREGTGNHEMTHSLQESYGATKKLGNGNDSDDQFSYYNDPLEIHARAANINQQYATRTKKALTKSNDVDSYVNNFITAIENPYLKAKSSDIENIMKKENIPFSGDVYYKWLLSDPKIRSLFGGMDQTEIEAMSDLRRTVDSQLKLKKNPKYDMKKALKALIMTTASNDEQQNQLQGNNVLSSEGFNIS